MDWRNYMTVFTIIFLIYIDKLHVQGHVPHLDGRIVGGIDANISYFPYQVSVQYNDFHICGGTIFHNYFILTAAHCLGRLASGYSIKAGSASLLTDGIVIGVCQYVMHEKYNSDTYHNDIAILRLCDPLEFTDNILPVYLPEEHDILMDGTYARVSGWGTTMMNGEGTILLQSIEVPIVPRRRCRELYQGLGLSDNMICAGYEFTGGRDACQGDSGGPLLAHGKLFGVVSWGVGCALPRNPGVYVNVPYYRTWIRTITNY